MSEESWQQMARRDLARIRPTEEERREGYRRWLEAREKIKAYNRDWWKRRQAGEGPQIYVGGEGLGEALAEIEEKPGK